jgi:hypothetical protein
MKLDSIDHAAIARRAHTFLFRVSQIGLRLRKRLAVLVPKRARQWWSRPAPVLLIAPEKGSLRVRYRHGGVETAAGSIDSNGHFISAGDILRLDSEAATVLVLPHVRAIIRRIKLPVVHGCRFDEITAMEMDRLTPFHSEEVLFALHDIAASDGGSAVTARLICLLHDDVLQYAALCAEAGLPIDVVSVCDTDRTVRPLKLVSRLPLRTHAKRFRVRLSIAALLLGSVLVTWQGPSFLQSRAASHLTARKLALLAQTETLSYGSEDGTIETALADKRSEVDMLGLLLALSHNLPREVVAESLSADRQSVRLVVRCDMVARASSALSHISMLSGVTLLHRTADGTTYHLTFHARWSHKSA